MSKLSQPTVTFQKAIIRLARGMLSAWEEWLASHQHT